MAYAHGCHLWRHRLTGADVGRERQGVCGLDNWQGHEAWANWWGHEALANWWGHETWANWWAMSRQKKRDRLRARCEQLGLGGSGECWDLFCIAVFGFES